MPCTQACFSSCTECSKACCIAVTQPGHNKHTDEVGSHTECTAACCTTTWPHYEHSLAIWVKCCRIYGANPSTLGTIITRTGHLSTSNVGLFFNFFRSDILGLFGPQISSFPCTKLIRLENYIDSSLHCPSSPLLSHPDKTVQRYVTHLM
jgi:hypothetical protein